MRGKATAAEQDARADIALISDEPETDQERNGAERHESDDLDEGEPELALAEFIDTKQIEEGDEQPKQHRPPDCPDLRQECIHDDARSNHLRGYVGHPRYPVGPAHTARPRRRDILARVDDERTRERLLHRQLCETEHHGEHDDAAQQIGNYRRRPRLLEDVARPQKISAPDHTTERDELKMSVLQPPFHRRLAHWLRNTTFLLEYILYKNALSSYYKSASITIIYLTNT